MTVRIVEPHQGVDFGCGQQVTPPPYEVLFVDSRGVLVAVVFQRGDDFGAVTSVLPRPDQQQLGWGFPHELAQVLLSANGTPG